MNVKILLLSICFILAINTTFAQKKSKKAATPSANTETNSTSKKAFKTIEEFKKKCNVKNGLFNVFQDTLTGEIYLEIPVEYLGKEFIHFSFIADGILDAGFFRGSYRSSRVFKIERYFNRLDFVVQNTSFYHDPNNAISKAAMANINNPVIISQKIEAISEGQKSFLIKADDLVLKETFEQVKPTPNPKNSNAFTLGTLSKDRSKINTIRNYPENIDFEVEMVYENAAPQNRGSNPAVTDARFVSVKIQHSIIQMPVNDFKPRFDDPRVGYFTTYVNDMTDINTVTPFRDYIHRWHLKKKNPELEVSEPVEPITWWVENTTPVEYRELVKQAVEAWNPAFEKAGFKNAIVCHIQPDNADWEAGDIRYNLIRWTSSPTPPFGGYGPSFVNPRTGQILGADVMIELVFLMNRLRSENLFDRTNFQLEDLFHNDHKHCALGLLLQHNHSFATTVMSANQDEDREEYIKQVIFYLILHEIGHTLGLNHNFKGSNLRTPEQLNDKEFSMKNNIANSVMEYPAINFALEKKNQGRFYDDTPGPYDYWAIEFGYSEGLDDEEAERVRLEKILSRSHKRELAFANDADDMRSSGKGIDPYAMIFDHSSDPIAYSELRLKLIDNTFDKIKERFVEEGKSYQPLTTAYLSLMNEMNIALRVATRWIGGVEVHRAKVGQNTAQKPFTPISATKQRQAMKLLSDRAFAPDAFVKADNLYAFLQQQRRGFSFFGQGEDPKIHQTALRIQSELLDHLLHPNVLQRITDSELYGNTYKLANVMNDLTDAIFLADLTGNVNTFRQNLQIEYTQRLLNALKNDNYDHIAKKEIFAQVKRVENIAGRISGDVSTRNHRVYLKHLIDQSFKK